MTKLLIWLGLFIGGWLGWWLGGFLGTGWSFLFSAAGSIGGIVLGWKIAADHF